MWCWLGGRTKINRKIKQKINCNAQIICYSFSIWVNLDHLLYCNYSIVSLFDMLTRLWMHYKYHLNRASCTFRLFFFYAATEIYKMGSLLRSKINTRKLKCPAFYGSTMAGKWSLKWDEVAHSNSLVFALWCGELWSTRSTNLAVHVQLGFGLVISAWFLWLKWTCLTWKASFISIVIWDVFCVLFE